MIPRDSPTVRHRFKWLNGRPMACAERARPKSGFDRRRFRPREREKMWRRVFVNVLAVAAIARVVEYNYDV